MVTHRAAMRVAGLVNARSALPACFGCEAVTIEFDSELHKNAQCTCICINHAHHGALSGILKSNPTFGRAHRTLRGMRWAPPTVESGSFGDVFCTANSLTGTLFPAAAIAASLTFACSSIRSRSAIAVSRATLDSLDCVAAATPDVPARRGVIMNSRSRVLCDSVVLRNKLPNSGTSPYRGIF